MKVQGLFELEVISNQASRHAEGQVTKWIKGLNTLRQTQMKGGNKKPEVLRKERQYHRLKKGGKWDFTVVLKTFLSPLMETGHDNLKWNTMKTCMCALCSFTNFFFYCHFKVPIFISSPLRSKHCRLWYPLPPPKNRSCQLGCWKQ